MKRSSELHHDTADALNMELSTSQQKTRRTIKSINRELYHEARDGNFDEVEALIAQGADVNNQEGDMKSSPLHMACENGHTDVATCLLRHKADVNLKNKNEHTPLHLAVNKDIVKHLVDYKADIHARDKIGRIPLHLSVKYPAVTEALLNAGSDGNLQDFKQRNPLHYSEDGGVAEILCRAKTDVNLQDMNGRTPLHEASWFNRHGVVRALLRAGSATTIRDKLNKTAYEMAVARESKEVIEMFNTWEKTQGNESLNPSDQENELNIPQEILTMGRQSVEIYKKALKGGMEKDYNIRIMVVGPYGVGKTTLINRLLQLGLDSDKIESTNGIDIHVHRSAVLLPYGQWILSEDEVKKLTDYDLRLGKVVTSYKPETTDSDLEMDGINEKPQAPTVATQSPAEKVHNDNSEVFTEVFPESTSSEPESGQNEHLDEKTKNHLHDLRRVIEALKSGNSENIYGEIFVWDFGGDMIFYTTHQTFLSPRGIYLVVVDISKELLDPFEDRDCYVDVGGVKFLKMGDYLVFWLNSIHTYGRNDEEGVPPVVIVATHLDKVQGDKEAKKEEFFEKIRYHLMENGMSLYKHLVDDDYAVDNTKTTDDPVLHELRQKIFEVAQRQKYWGEDKPASWIALEKLLMEKQKNGIKLLSFQEVMDLSLELDCGIRDHDQLNVFLKFQHAIGKLIYFSDLKEFIILDPKWLVHAFRCLITHDKFQKKKPCEIKLQWQKCWKSATLTREVIDAIWKDEVEYEFYHHRDHLLSLMTKMDIIARPVMHAEGNIEQKLDYYFVPPMLRDKITDNQLHGIKANALVTPNLNFVFQNHFIPPAVFHRLIAACMKKWHVARQGKDSKPLLFCGCGIFDIDRSQTTRVMICMKNYMIKLCVFHYNHQNPIMPDVTKSVEIRNFVAETLRHIFDRYEIFDGDEQNVPYKLHIDCSPKEEGMLAVEDLMAFTNINCTRHDESHSVSSKELLKYWYPPQDYEHKHLQNTKEEKNVTGLPYGYADHRPTEALLLKIARKIGSEFQQLGIMLGLSYTEIEQIKCNNPNNVVMQCFHILSKWTKKCYEEATLGNLHKAMLEVDCDVEALYNILCH